MARIIYRHPSQTEGRYHIFTDLDFWDAKRILAELAQVRRNFGRNPSGDEFPTQIVCEDPTRGVRSSIENRLKRAIVSPPRHVIVQVMIDNGSFEFDPAKYYPPHWSRKRMRHFTWHRLPLEQSALSTPYHTSTLEWKGDLLRVERVRRTEKYDPVVKSKKESMRRLRVPSCF
jgi:hypothetical protein